MVHAALADEYPATVGALRTGGWVADHIAGLTRSVRTLFVVGLKDAAHTGERPRPRCVNKLGASAREVMAEFCLTDNA